MKSTPPPPPPPPLSSSPSVTRSQVRNNHHHRHHHHHHHLHRRSSSTSSSKSISKPPPQQQQYKTWTESISPSSTSSGSGWFTPLTSRLPGSLLAGSADLPPRRKRSGNGRLLPADSTTASTGRNRRAETDSVFRSSTSSASDVIWRYESSQSATFKDYTTWKESKWGEDNLDEVQFEEDDVGLELSLPTMFTNPLLHFPSCHEIIQDLYTRIAACTITLFSIAMSSGFHLRHPTELLKAISAAMCFWLPKPPAWIRRNFISVVLEGRATASSKAASSTTSFLTNLFRDDGWEEDDELLNEGKENEYMSGSNDDDVRSSSSSRRSSDSYDEDEDETRPKTRNALWQISLFILGFIFGTIAFCIIIPFVCIRAIIPTRNRMIFYDVIIHWFRRTFKLFISPPAQPYPSPTY